jgi:hypothetical protein
LRCHGKHFVSWKFTGKSVNDPVCGACFLPDLQFLKTKSRSHDFEFDFFFDTPLSAAFTLDLRLSTLDQLSGSPNGLVDRTFFIRFQFAGHTNGLGFYQIKQVRFSNSATLLTVIGHKGELTG